MQTAEGARQFDIGSQWGLQDRLAAQSVAEQAEIMGRESEAERRQREDWINQQQLEQYQGYRDENLAALDPFNQSAQAAVQQRNLLMGLGGTPAEQQAAMDRFANSPGQQYKRDQMAKQVARQASATGGLGGGNRLAELQKRGFELAQTDYANEIARLSGVAGEGLGAAKIQAGMGFGPGYTKAGETRGIASSDFNKYQFTDPGGTREFNTGKYYMPPAKTGGGGRGPLGTPDWEQAKDKMPWDTNPTGWTGGTPNPGGYTWS
jgi:hypothetical protein